MEKLEAELQAVCEAEKAKTVVCAQHGNDWIESIGCFSLTSTVIRTSPAHSPQPRARTKAYDVLVVRSRQSDAERQCCFAKKTSDTTELDWEAESHGRRIGKLRRRMRYLRWSFA